MKKILMMLALLCTIVQGAWAEAGDTADNPITINNTEEWNTFVSNVNSGTSYSGKFVRLDADISVTEMAGSSETNSFQGTFLGNDKTLTFTKGSSESAFGEENCAPFRFTNNATFQDLNVSGDIYTSQKYAAGLVARNAGTTTITNCRVSTVIHSSVSNDDNDGTHGGIVAMPASGATTNITGCVYNGRLLTTNGTNYCGGFVGWSGTTTVTVTNSLYAPNTALPASGDETAIDNGATFVRGSSNMTINANCYYTEAMGSAQGAQVYATIPDGEIYKPVTVANTTVYLLCTVSNVAEYYMYTGSEIAVVPTVTCNGTQLTAGTDYNVSISPGTVQALGQYTMTITGSTGDYTGSKNISFKVVGPLSGTGSSTDPYLIQNAGDWWYFANTVNNGNSYSGKYVQLEADIDIDLPVGVRTSDTDTKPFSGTFLGNNKTIQVSLASDGNSGLAPFRQISGATIKNLNVAGTITSNNWHAAALVGFSQGTGNSIQNCTVSANVSGNGYVGGIVGHSTDSDISISDCVYSGLMTGGGNCTRVFIGWGDSGTRSVTDCLYIMADGQSTSNFDLVKEGGTLTMDRLYKTTSAGSQGTLVSSTAPVDGVYQSITAANNNTYYIILIVSNVKEYYRYTGSAIAIEPSVTAGSINGPALTEDTDYTYTLSPATVQEVGSYTLTFTGIGNYTGTKTCNIRVLGSDEYYPINSEMTTLASDKYGVFQDLEITSRINIRGDVTLFLGEGTTLHAPKGIELSAGNSLTIEGPGALTINGCDYGKSGIGAQDVGTLTINGGTINVTGGYYAAGIGGSFQNFEGGNIIINGGVVNATGGYWAAGIGGGHYSLTAETRRGYCCNITINGGQVTAIGNVAYGIGPGVNGESSSGSLKIGWTKLTDFFNSTFNLDLDHVSFADGKIFLIDGTKTLATINTISSGKKIVPFELSPLSGHGTEGDPYLISNDDQWITFAYYVNNGTSYNGEFVKLDANISASTMVGTSDNKFKGTFLGDGDYTLTFTHGTAQSAFGEQYCAPFRYTDGATIQNLKVEGYIYTSQKYAAGLVARNAGTTTITNCRVSTVIHSSVGSDGTHGGFIALPEGDVNFSNCVYDGRMFTSSGTDQCGGFIGWHNSKTFNITNSLYAPNPNITPADNEVAIATSCATFVRGGSPAEGSTCYYTQAMGTAQGTQVYATIPENEICKAATICNTTVYIMPVCTVSGIEESYSLNNDVEITPVVKYNETSLAFGTDYTATLDGQTVASFPVSPNKMGTYTLILTGAGDYAGEKSFYITLMPEAVTLTDAGTYSFKADVNVASATYTKSLGESRVGKHQAWFVPFDYTIKEADTEKFDFYKINMIANAPNPQTNVTDDIWVFLKKMNADEVLRANMPYVYKPKEAVTDYAFTTENATLKAKATDARLTMMTAEDTYTVFGTYEPTTATAGDPFYYVNIDGDLSLGNDGSVTVGAFRWIIRMESKFGTPNVSYAREMHFFDGEENTTGVVEAEANSSLFTLHSSLSEWFTLDGRKLDGKPTAKGIYVHGGRKTVVK